MTARPGRQPVFLAVVAVAGFFALWFQVRLAVPDMSTPWALLLAACVGLPHLSSAGLLCFARTREGGLAIAAAWGALVLLVGVPLAYLDASFVGRKAWLILTVALAHGFWAVAALVHVPRGGIAWAVGGAAALAQVAVFALSMRALHPRHERSRGERELRAAAEVERAKAEAERRRVQDLESTVGRCQGGSTDDCLGAARALLNGPSPGRPRAAGLFQTACERRVWIGCAELSEMYRLGLDVPRDLARSKEWRIRACEVGHGPSCALLGWEAGSSHDLREALGFWEKGCALAHASSCLEAFWTIRKGSAAASLPPDHDRAAPFGRRACELGEEAACRVLRGEASVIRAARPPRPRARSDGHR
jgi:hypothetical protein